MGCFLTENAGTSLARPVIARAQIAVAQVRWFLLYLVPTKKFVSNLDP